MLLPNTSSKMQLVTSSATPTMHVQSNYIDRSSSGTITPSTPSNQQISAATTSDIVGVPGASTVRRIISFTVYNSHASTSNTCTIQQTDGSTTVTKWKGVVGPGECLVYDEYSDFTLLDSTGVPKRSVSSPQMVLSSPSNPTGTSNTTGLMMGLNVAFTPTTTGRVLVNLTGMLANNTIGDGASVQLRFGTGTAPINTAALTGTTVGVLKNMIASTAAGKQGVALSGIITGLTVGTAIWIDVGLKAVTGGTATLFDVDAVVIEL